MPLDILSKLVWEAPLPSLAVAFMLVLWRGDGSSSGAARAYSQQGVLSKSSSVNFAHLISEAFPD
jgi:hypothetical protein